MKQSVKFMYFKFLLFQKKNFFKLKQKIDQKKYIILIDKDIIIQYKLSLLQDLYIKK